MKRDYSNKMEWVPKIKYVLKRWESLFVAHPVIYVLAICGLVAFAAISIRFGVLNNPGNVRTKVSSTLMKSVDIAELSTAEFKYRGIAEIYSDEERTQVKCHVCYDAIVRAGIDMKKVQPYVDDAKKAVKVILPEIDLKVIIIDEQSMAILPSDADVGIDSMLRFSREDAEREAKESQELLNTAKENLHAIIHSLLYPVLEAYGYSLVWD